MKRDPFARGEYDRKTVTVKDCDWCGRKPRRLYDYAWRSDDDFRPRVAARGKQRGFCNFGCYANFHNIPDRR
jgi:hypothetical protein